MSGRGNSGQWAAEDAGALIAPPITRNLIPHRGVLAVLFVVYLKPINPHRW
jgi:hypothetical protein